MLAKWFWFLLSLISTGALVVALNQPDFTDLALLAGPLALASTLIFLRLLSRRPAPTAGMLVVDGSNVMYWKDNTPRLETVKELVNLLKQEGFRTGVMFDANAGYLVSDRYLHDHAFARLLGLPEEHVMVVPKGTPADHYILDSARFLGARIVTNDRFRDWAEAFPEVYNPGYLVRGRYADDQIMLQNLHPPETETA